MVSLSWLNVDQVCAAVDFTGTPASLDLSDVTFFDQFSVIYLGMFVRYHTSHGTTLEVYPPNATKAREYLARQRFWERFNFTEESITREKQFRTTTGTSLNNIIDIERRERVGEDIADQVQRLLQESQARVRSDEVAEIVAELVENFAQHSKGELAAFTMQWYPNMKRVVLALGDCGIGIRTSLSSVTRYARLRDAPHWDAAAKAFEAGVTRKREGGTGLTLVQDSVRLMRGSMLLTTGDGYVQTRANGKVVVGQMAYDLSGVQLEVVIPERR
jgi:hypothetical protein